MNLKNALVLLLVGLVSALTLITQGDARAQDQPNR